MFVDSHGRGDLTILGNRYGYFPHPDLLTRGQATPHYSARDLARTVGGDASRIHNILIAGCNEEGSFRPQELRRYFPNATNITHMPAGQNGFKSLFYSAIVNPSTDNRPIYATPGHWKSGREAFRLEQVPTHTAKKVSPYVANLFLPGAQNPYRVQTAGRELIDPPRRVMLTAQARLNVVQRQP